LVCLLGVLGLRLEEDDRHLGHPLWDLHLHEDLDHRELNHGPI
jgi:hypothetical protein